MHKLITSSVTLLTLLFSLICPVFAVDETTAFDLSPAGLQFIKQYEKEHSQEIDEKQEEELLRETMLPYIKQVNQFINNHNIEIQQHQFDALVSFTYSLGSSWMNPSNRFTSYVIQGIDQYEDAEIIDSMGVWCHVKSTVNEAYLQRRIDEGRLLLYGDYDSKNSTEFHYLILDPTEGYLENDVVCYEAGKPYQTLPTATRSNYTLDGWYTAQGKKLSPDMLASQNLKVIAKWTPDSSLTFKDVNPSHWFYSTVYDLYQSGVINGYSPDMFAPNDTVTYGQALKLILLAANYGDQKSTDSHWASGYWNLAVKQGFLSSAQIDLDKAISRLEIAHITQKALHLSDVNSKSPFSDTSDPAVRTLYHHDIIKGSYENDILVFKPDSNITRAEISTVIWRIKNMDYSSAPEPKPEPEPEPEPDHTGQFEYNGQWLDILKNVPLNQYDPLKFYKSNGFTRYRSNEYRCEIGVDVSIYQGDIDWKQVKDAGVDFAIIRVGGRGWGSEGNIYIDKKFHQNIKGALDAGLEVGIYFFSQAITEEEAIEEARFTINQIKDYNITYPVVFDWELIGGREARTYNLDTEILGDAANAFCREIEKAGYRPMIYFNTYCGYFKFDLSQIMDYDFWFAQYNATPKFYYHFHMWQYTSTGKVNGIPGKVDINLYLIKK